METKKMKLAAAALVEAEVAHTANKDVWERARADHAVALGLHIEAERGRGAYNSLPRLAAREAERAAAAEIVEAEKPFALSGLALSAAREVVARPEYAKMLAKLVAAVDEIHAICDEERELRASIGGPPGGLSGIFGCVAGVLDRADVRRSLHKAALALAATMAE